MPKQAKSVEDKPSGNPRKVPYSIHGGLRFGGLKHKVELAKQRQEVKQVCADARAREEALRQQREQEYELEKERKLLEHGATKEERQANFDMAADALVQAAMHEVDEQLCTSITQQLEHYRHIHQDEPTLYHGHWKRDETSTAGYKCTVMNRWRTTTRTRINVPMGHIFLCSEFGAFTIDEALKARVAAYVRAHMAVNRTHQLTCGVVSMSFQEWVVEVSLGPNDGSVDPDHTRIVDNVPTNEEDIQVDAREPVFQRVYDEMEAARQQLPQEMRGEMIQRYFNDSDITEATQTSHTSFLNVITGKKNADVFNVPGPNPYMYNPQEQEEIKRLTLQSVQEQCNEYGLESKIEDSDVLTGYMVTIAQPGHLDEFVYQGEPRYEPTSPAYSPTSPSYNPPTPGYPYSDAE